LDYIIPFALIAAAALLHGVRLDAPNSVIFDEVHYGKYLTAYCCSHELFFDVHPPHGKLIMAFFAYLFGYRGGFTFSDIGLDYGQIPAAALRMAPALAGTAIPALFFLLLRRLGASVAAALLGGLCLLFDNALLVETRFIGLDGILVAAAVGSMWCFLAGWEGAPHSAGSWRHLLWLLAAGGFAGAAFGTKMIGLMVIALETVFALWTMDREKTAGAWIAGLRRTLWLWAGFALIYVGGWWIHYQLQAGPGDDAFGIRAKGSFFTDMVHYHVVAYHANDQMSSTHPYASQWWTWPLMGRPIFYWGGGDTVIYFLGNPVVWWVSGLVLLFGGLCLAWGRLVKVAPKGAGWSLACDAPLGFVASGYVCSFFPLAFISRDLFMYHYLIPLSFAVAFGVLCFDRWGLTRGRDDLPRQPRIYYAAVGLLVVGFIVVSPVTYGFSSGVWLKRVLFSIFPQ
jgi:dolichyl-phosphate-mannose-protein mannosyltransferase